MDRRTFVAVSFGPARADALKVNTLSYVSYVDNHIEHADSISFIPVGFRKGAVANAKPFELAFNKIGYLFNAHSIAPPVVPVVVWDDRVRRIFDTLIHESEINYLAYPPRYFILQKYASRKLWDSSEVHSVQEIAERLSIKVGTGGEPDAACIAAILRRIEDVIEFPPVVAKAFCAICNSVIDDGVIEEKEAVELSAFLQLISDRYPEFKQLENALDDAVGNKLLRNGFSTPESARLIEMIREMLGYFKKFTGEENNGENV